MKYSLTKLKKIHINEFYVIGILAETTYSNEKCGADISNLWMKFLMGNMQNNIPNKLGDKLYCAYRNFRNNYSDFDVIVGCQVSSLSEIPEGMVGITVPAMKYQEYFLVGALPDCLIPTWRTFNKNREGRAFNTEFEVYEKDHPDNFDEVKIQIYVSML